MRLAAFLLVCIAWLGLASMPSEARPPSPGQADRLVPQDAKPGTLLSYDRIALPGNYRAMAWRVLYVTRDYRMRPILSTGLVVRPDNAPRIPMERKFVAWAHPTTGIARKCAPSLRASPMKAIGGLNGLVAGGLVVTATDYPGLGTEGPIGYLVGKGQAYAVLDSVRAAKQIPGVGGGNEVALWGYSQGAHAALFASELARQYAPELAIKGVAAVAPPTDLATLMRANLHSVAGRILAAFTLASWRTKYGAPIAPLLDGMSEALVDEVGKSCIDDLGGKLDALAAQKGLKQDFLREDPALLPPWSALMAMNSLFTLTPGTPALIIQGLADDIVRPHVTTEFVQHACRAGVKVEYVRLKGKGHGGAMDAGSRQAVNWLAARLRGVPARSNCR